MFFRVRGRTGTRALPHLARPTQRIRQSLRCSITSSPTKNGTRLSDGFISPVRAPRWAAAERELIAGASRGAHPRYGIQGLPLSMARAGTCRRRGGSRRDNRCGGPRRGKPRSRRGHDRNLRRQRAAKVPRNGRRDCRCSKPTACARSNRRDARRGYRGSAAGHRCRHRQHLRSHRPRLQRRVQKHRRDEFRPRRMGRYGRHDLPLYPLPQSTMSRWPVLWPCC